MKQVSGRELARAVERRGWALVRVNGSHHVYMKPGSPVRLSIPIHGSKALKPGLLGFLLKSAGLRIEDV